MGRERASSDLGSIERHSRRFQSVQSCAEQLTQRLTAIGLALEGLGPKERAARLQWEENSNCLAESSRKTMDASCKLSDQLHSLEVQIEQMEGTQSFGVGCDM